MSRFPRSLLILAVILHLIPIAARPRLIGGDEPHYALIAHSIATDGDVSVSDDYDEVEQGSPAAGVRRAGERLDRHLREIDGRVLPSHPVGLPLLIAPALLIQRVIAPTLPPDYLLILLTSALSLAAFLAGWRRLIGWLGTRSGSLLAFALWFGTPLWYYSRIFVTEPYLVVLVIFGAIAAADRNGWLAGVCAGLAFWIKEPSVLLSIPLVVFLVRTEPRAGLRSMIAGFPFVILWLAKNLLLYGVPIATFQAYQYGNLVRGLIGTLLDPAHGLIPFAPVAVLALGGWLRGPSTPPLRLSLAAFIAYVLLVAAWSDWSGGSGYGPRLLVPTLPLLAISATTLLRRLPVLGLSHRIVILTGAAGFSVNAVAALDPWTAFWRPDVGDAIIAKPLVHLFTLAVGVLLLGGITRWRANP